MGTPSSQHFCLWPAGGNSHPSLPQVQERHQWLEDSTARATKMLSELEHLSSEQRLREFSRRRGSFGETEQQPIISFWWSLRKWSWPSQLVNKGGARDSWHSLVQEMFRRDVNRNSGTGCVERLFCFHPWRFPESSWVPEKQWVGLEMFWRLFCPWSYHSNSS